MDFASIALALALGFVAQRSYLCTVANVERFVVRRRADGLLGLVVAICWAAAVLLGLAWVFPGQVRLPAEHAISWTLVIGGLVLGFGSAINGGCFVGSIVRIGSGDLNFLATLVGIGLGLRWMPELFPEPIGWAARPAVRHLVTGTGLYAVLWLALLLIGVASLLAEKRRGRLVWVTWRGRWPRVLALALTGTVAGLMYARSPDWSYAIAIEAVAVPEKAQSASATLLAPVALFAGAVISARLAGSFRLARPTLQGLARGLMGGTLMGAGAQLVPGGNDTLLLWSMPGLTLYGVVAYAAMVAAIALVMLPGRRRNP